MMVENDFKNMVARPKLQENALFRPKSEFLNLNFLTTFRFYMNYKASSSNLNAYIVFGHDYKDVAWRGREFLYILNYACIMAKLLNF